MDIANRIKTLRVENNMTQKQLSEKLGLTPKMISFYEKGERIPPLDIVEKLVTIFSTSADYIIGLEKNHASYDSTPIPISVIREDMPTYNTCPQETKLWNAFKELNEDNQDIIIGKIKELLREQRISSNKPSQDTTTNEYPTTYAEFQKLYPTASPSNYQKEKNDVG